MERKKTDSEIEFFHLFKDARWSTQDEDMFQHIDVYVEDMSVDVKGMKKTNRDDETVDASIHWIELQNVNGDKGWLYGGASHIAFELIDSYLIIERTILHQFCKEKIVDRKIKNTKGLYTLYRRKGRQDVLTIVLTEDLLKLPHRILNKVLRESS